MNTNWNLKFQIFLLLLSLSNHRDISSFMTYHWVCSKSNSTDVKYGVGTAYPSEHLSSPTFVSWVRVVQSLVLCVVFCRKVFVFLSFFLFAIVLSVLLWITSSDYSFGILIFVWSEKHKSAFEQKFPFQSSHLSNLLFVNNQENKLFIPLWV